MKNYIDEIRTIISWNYIYDWKFGFTDNLFNGNLPEFLFDNLPHEADMVFFHESTFNFFPNSTATGEFIDHATDHGKPIKSTI